MLPSKAMYLATTAVIPEGYQIVYLQADSIVFSPSSFYLFLKALLPRLAPGVRIRILCSKDDLLARCIEKWQTEPWLGERVFVSG